MIKEMGQNGKQCWIWKDPTGILCTTFILTTSLKVWNQLKNVSLKK